MKIIWCSNEQVNNLTNSCHQTKLWVKIKRSPLIFIIVKRALHVEKYGKDAPPLKFASKIMLISYLTGSNVGIGLAKL